MSVLTHAPSSPVPSALVNRALNEILPTEFWQTCTPAQKAMLEPVVRRLSVVPEEPQPSEEERAQAALAKAFPSLFVQPTPRTVVSSVSATSGA